MVIHAIHIFSEDVLEVVFSYVDEDASKGKKTNIFIAAFTTAQARLKFYSSLNPLRDQVLYYDTRYRFRHLLMQTRPNHDHTRRLSQQYDQ